MKTPLIKIVNPNKHNFLGELGAYTRALFGAVIPKPSPYRSTSQTSGRSFGRQRSPLLSRDNSRPNKYRPHQGEQEKARRRAKR
jgi:hypothetical protein